MSQPDRTAAGASTLVDILRWRAEHQPDRLAYTFLLDGETAEASLTFGELDRWAKTIGAWLQALGTVGERVMLVCPPGLQYVAGFFGCLYAGAIAVPSYPPRAARTIDTLLAIMQDAQARVVLSTSELRTLVESGIGQHVGLPATTFLTTEDPSEGVAASWRHPGSRLEDLAFLQYTSGSTGTPKGVMVGHGNLAANMAAGRDAVGLTADSLTLSWLPPFHDMGLISGVLQTVFTGAPSILMAPVTFIQRPARWLWGVSRYGATHSGGPPFAYDYCRRKITPRQLEGVDLRSWRVAYVGAEPIRVDGLERFVEMFAPYGFRPDALLTAYGMAEATLMVSGGPARPRPVACTVNAAALEENRVVEAAAGAVGSRVLAGCGHPLRDTTVAIADPDRLTRCRPDEVGEIWVQSPGVAHGYWRRPEESEQTFRARLLDTGDGPFLRTGDLGFVKDGEVYVTGRHKDLVIIHGKNHYPQDVEQTVERCDPAARPAGGAAFAVDVDGEERLVVVQEVEAEYVQGLDADALIAAIRQAVAEAHDVEAYAVVLVRPGTIPKTSSGKIRRRACRAAYLEGRLSVVALAVAPRAVSPALTPDPSPASGRGEASGAHSPSPALRERGPGGEGSSRNEANPDAEEIQRWLVARLAEILHVEQRVVDVHEPFVRYGLSSTEAVGLSGDLEDWLGRRLSPTLVYECPTIEAVARRLGSEAEDAAPSAPRPVDPSEPIAIVGLGCRLPGAENPDRLWRLLRDGVDAIGEVPPDRWPIDTAYDPDPDAPGKMSTRFGGFLERVDGFDADFFRIAAREAVAMDPQQRLLLEVVWEALEDAGQAPDRLAGSRTGVFVGMSSADYARLHMASGDPAAIDAYSGTGVAFSVAVGRISYVLGLHGPNLAVDTSCSSGLVAVHLACQSLRTGESDLALAGGVNLMLAPETSVFLSKAHALAPDGRCKTFDASADGYARGEGCGVVVLKPLADALADGDRVLALIRGSAINHDGRSNGLTAPNGTSQEAVIRAALAQAGVEPKDVGYVEAHGTGTALGDPIEVRALANCLGPDRPADRPFALGSIKTNVGHLEAAAGLAGLLKAVLVLRHGQIPPHLHLRQPSPYIPWSELPLVVPTELIPWPAGYQRRIAGVSAFGFSGTNAHVVLEEAPAFPAAPRDDVPVGAPHLLPISARSPSALRALVLAYCDLLGPLGTSASLRDVCYTASVRRNHYEYRLAVVGRSREELVERLREELGVGGQEPEAEGALEALAEAYARGEDPDWSALYPNGGRCVSLPSYPWQRERFWIERVPAPAPQPVPPVVAPSLIPRPPLPLAGDREHDAPSGDEPPARPPSADVGHPFPAAAGEGPGDGASRDQSGLEIYLSDLVARAIERPAAWIERDRSLADLGLDSLMAMEIKNRIEGDLGIVVPVTTFLLGPSIAELAASLLEGSAADLPTMASVPADGALPPEALDVDLPLSHGQRALWLTQQLAPRSTAYHIMFAARLREAIDVAAMASAVQALVDRHASLWTTYVVRDGQSVQRICREMPASFEAIDAAGWSDAELRAHLGEAADRPFDLERGPLLRVTLFRRSPAEAVLLLAVHHVAVDFWSLEVLVNELQELYEAARSGRPAVLPAPRQYVDFVRWQADLLAGPAGDRLWDYWSCQLAGELPTLSLPTDRPRPRVQTYRGALHDFTLDADLARRLRDLARAEGATLYATLLAAFSALLARYSGQDDILVGSPMAGRGRADFERTVGYLVNVVPLRTDLSGRPTFRELLRQARDTVLAALDHQHYPFPLLLDRLKVPRDPSRSPLVQVLFIWYRSALLEAAPTPQPPSALPWGPSIPTASQAGEGETGLGSIVAWEQRGAPYDVMLLMTEVQGSLPGRFQYNADLFDPSTIARLVGHFQQLLASAVAEPDRPVDALPMLAPVERRRILVEWNATEAPYPADACLHELFEAQAVRTPDATALVRDGERLTYRDLNRRANRVARRLQVLGIGPDRLVGVCLERSPALVVGLLGVLKAGGAYLPLDPAYPEARLAYMIADSGASVLLTERRFAETFGGRGAEVVCLDDPASLADIPGAFPDDENPVGGATPSSLAYVTYTSGSTGRPKGVAIEHRGPVALMAWARDAFEPDDLAGVLFSTSVCFDLSVFEVFVPLSWGGTVILAESILQLPRLPAADAVTLVNTVPSALAEVLRIGPLPPSVRVVTSCGEVLTNAVAEEAYRRGSVRRVVNLYGPTEDTVYSTAALIEQGATEEPAIGRPIANKRVYLLDDRLQPVPVGVPGEVYTAGIGLARGYLHRPELTAERFIQNPLPEEPGERLYRVGDLARYRPDGSIEFLGRVDNQVKVRGFRIELGEIEVALDRHPAVRESVVVAREDRPGLPQLVAYLVPEPPIDGQGQPTVGEIRRFLQRDLPDYMLPSALAWLEALPRTPNGKLDRARLPALGTDRPHLDAEYVAPRTPEETLLAGIWSEVLGVERVGVHDSFFDLGGASLASVTIAAKAQAAGLPLAADVLFAYPTIAELSALAAQVDPLPTALP